MSAINLMARKTQWIYLRHMLLKSPDIFMCAPVLSRKDRHQFITAVAGAVIVTIVLCPMYVLATSVNIYARARVTTINGAIVVGFDADGK